MQHLSPSDTHACFVKLLRNLGRGKREKAIQRAQGLRAELQGSTMTRDEILAARHESHTH